MFKHVFNVILMHLVLRNVPTSILAKDNQSQAASTLASLNIHELCTHRQKLSNCLVSGLHPFLAKGKQFKISDSDDIRVE